MIRTGAAVRVALVAVLLAVTVVGLRSRGAFTSAPDAAVAGATGAVLVTALAACEGVALVAFIVLLVAARPQRRPRDDEEPERLVFPWWAKTAGVLLALALLVTPFVVLFTRPGRKHPAPVPPARLVNPVSGSRPPGVTSSSAWPLIAGMVIAIAVVLTLILLTRGRRGRPRPHLDRLTALAEGLAAGHAALQANDDPRTAIIACYAALERGFAAAGSAPAAADTPAEVLTRALAAGIIASGPQPGSQPAAILTSLFRRARYSAEPMTSADAAAAATALTELHTALEAAQESEGVFAGAGR